MTLAELIDFELALARDRDRPFEELMARDRRIAAAVPADTPAGPSRQALLRAWLEAQRGSARPTAGERAAEGHGLLAAALFVGGFALGAAAVSGWLVSRGGLPVNVIVFWPALIGVQIALALLWWIAVIPPRAANSIPGLREFHRLLVALGRAAPALAARLFRAAAARGVGPADVGLLRRLETLYGRLAFWIAVAQGQAFAVGFNVGAWLALLAIPYLDDPAFGWRSRLLDPAELAEIAGWIAAPWAGLGALLGSAAPWTVSLEEVVATQYSSLDPEVIDRIGAASGMASAWSAWWPFLLASLAVYGALPRVIFWGVAHWRCRRALAAAPAGHADAERLRLRLESAAVQTRGSDAAAPVGGETGSAVDLAPFRLDERPVALLLWPSGAGGGADLAPLVGATPRCVVAVDPGHPEAALETLRRELAAAPDARILLAIEASEPPVGEVLDLLAHLRSELDPRLPIAVGLWQRGGIESRHRSVWKRVLAERGDPYLSLVDLEPAAT